MLITSNQLEIPAAINTVYEFLLDTNNLQLLMPAERIEGWESTNTSCRFKIKNMGGIQMKHNEIDAPTKIQLVSDGKNPFEFTLEMHLESASENSTLGHVTFDAKANTFLAMMIEKPLTAFFNHLVEQLVNRYSAA